MIWFRSHHAIAFALAVLALASNATAAKKRNSQPNIVVIVVDDQDYHLNSMDHMDILQKQLVEQGAFFTKHYGHVSQCCPARATIWTGKHAHNTNVTSVVNHVAGGAWKQIQKNGYYKNYLPVWMQDAGYNTYYSGKLFNGYGAKTYCDPVCAEGWSKADILTEPDMYKYYNTSWARFDGVQWSYDKEVLGYNTDQIAENVANYIDGAASSSKPFFAVAGTIAPHISLRAKYDGNNTRFPYPVPKDEYSDLFQDLQLPRGPNFNPDNRTGVNAVWSLEKLNDTNIAYLDEYYRMRQRSLKSVDDLIQTIVQKLSDTGTLDDTYIFYSSDNGYHIGNHRLQPGKLQCFEEDINIPFIVRGPDVAANQKWDIVSGHIDIAPTMLTLAGVDVTNGFDFDGTPITFPLQSERDYFRNFDQRGEIAHLEFWGPFRQEGRDGGLGVDYNINLQIYKALRIQGKGYNLMYSVWCQNGAHELYDMSWDTHQMTNLHPNAPSENGTNAYQMGMTTLLGRPVERVIHRLDAMVLVQKSCSGDVCREPWKQLHPNGGVKTLMGALQEKYDGYYKNSYELAKVGWQQCYTGLNSTSSSTLYLHANENPLWLNTTVVHLVRSAGQKRYSLPSFCCTGPTCILVLMAYLGLVSFVV